ncbi:ABC transporter ATP-binding protein [Bifidobacterium callitrichos]|uniref:ABC transporter ATP-binding protein n=1 Tax=Bifidobacterium callitrichos TaxID=762209 RepID=A0A5M9Z9I9_9BIFI|nr:ABC transporter ATP-binding protein [Bifidobacterium callitrichos]KAA8815169.1 ABC transporter ATP-binding protein [Bifidobacterium callitrichos]
MSGDDNLIAVHDLRVEATADGRPLVDGVSFDVARGETVGIVGESGSGKSLTLRAIMGLMPEGVRIADPAAVATPSARPRLAMIFQDPVASLDPLCGVVKQVAEVMRCREKGDSGHAGRLSRRFSPNARRESHRRAADLLISLGLPESLREHDRYPGQLSGGQCQRVGIAIALAVQPDVLLCDEPTTALDVTVQRQILDLLARLRGELGLTMLFVTHNLGVAAHLCDRLIVMHHGRIVETGPTGRILADPQDDYTKRLIDAILPIPADPSEKPTGAAEEETGSTAGKGKEPR